MRSLICLSLLLASGCQSVGAAERTRRATSVERMLFDLCPMVLSGGLDLGDSRQLEVHGLAPAETESGWVYAKLAGPPNELLIGFRQFTANGVCRLRFEGPDNQAIVRHLLSAGAARGWRTTSGPAELGGFIGFLQAPDTSRRRIMFIHHPASRGLAASSSAGMILDRP